MTPRRIAIVPHSHWDREWYKSYQDFRLNLVDMLDVLLPLLESDASYPYFMLDGQMAVVDDYLEVRPEAEPRLRGLAAAGRISMGPWYILMDEFLSSGETIIRNLQMGIVRAAAFGGAMNVGYLPDMFGHIAQMPQILQQAGFEHAVVWRGVPSAITKNAFWWESPDGSHVRAEYLPVGYSNGSALPDDAKALVRRAEDLVQEVAPFLFNDLLCMNGSDHLFPQSRLGRVVAEANELQDELVFDITSLPKYLAAAPTEELQRWEGELRSGYRSNMLMGVTSNRVDVKRMGALAERALEQRAEPLAALFQSPAQWPRQLLSLAWKEVVRNSAHDSICACSVDDVVDAVLHRYAEARTIASGLADRALMSFARSLAEPGNYVLNAVRRARRGRGRTRGGGGRTALERRPGGVRAGGPARLNGARCQYRAHGARPATRSQDRQRRLGACRHHRRGRSGTRRHRHGRGRGTAQRTDIRSQAGHLRPPGGQAGRRHPRQLEPATHTSHRGPGHRGPGLRLAAVYPSGIGPPGDGERARRTAGTGQRSRRGEGRRDTGYLFRQRERGLRPTGRRRRSGGFVQLFAPRADTLVDTPTGVSVRVVESGPVRARVAVTASFVWPDHVDGSSQKRVGEQHVEVETLLELRADESVVRVTTSFVNPSRDHRLRVHLPLPAPARSSRAESAFAVVERGLTAEGRSDEFGLPTAPAHRFVSAGGLTVVHDGVCEYELIDIASTPDGDAAATIALTVLRATGMLSRLGMAYRPFPAGPLTPVEGLQMTGRRVSLHYALAVGHDDPYALADDVLLPLDVVSALGGGSRPGSGSALTVEGAEVSALLRQNGLVEVRVFNPRSTSATVSLPGHSGWLIDLRGYPVRPFEGSFELRPFGIATARLRTG